MIGFIPELDDPSHCAIGFIILRSIVSTSLFTGVPYNVFNRNAYNGSQENANITTTTANILTAFTLDLCTISKLVFFAPGTLLFQIRNPMRE